MGHTFFKPCISFFDLASFSNFFSNLAPLFSNLADLFFLRLPNRPSWGWAHSKLKVRWRFSEVLDGCGIWEVLRWGFGVGVKYPSYLWHLSYPVLFCPSISSFLILSHPRIPGQSCLWGASSGDKKCAAQLRWDHKKKYIGQNWVPSK